MSLMHDANMKRFYTYLPSRYLYWSTDQKPGTPRQCRTVCVIFNFDTLPRLKMTGKGQTMLRITVFYKNIGVLSESVIGFISDVTELENKDRRFQKSICRHELQQACLRIFRLQQNCKKRLLASSCPSVLPSGLNSVLVLRFDIRVFHEIQSREFKFHYIRIRKKDALHEQDCTLLISCYSSQKGKCFRWKLQRK